MLEAVKKDDRRIYLGFLLLADESEEMVSEYINEGEMYVIKHAGETVGVVLFTFPSARIVEIKNIAFLESFRGRGLGKMVVLEAFDLYRSHGFEKMIVGTANSSIANLAFYQKAGFRMAEIKRDFFKKYPTPIFENGIRALDMVMFEKQLN
jgi:ribosomal protein S18 acetylase RimI-like enzyme